MSGTFGQKYVSIINLVVRRLNVYVGKERMFVFPVAIPVAMTQKAVAMVVRGNWDKKKTVLSLSSSAPVV